MITAFDIYLIGIVDDLKVLTNLLGIAPMIVAMIFALLYAITEGNFNPVKKGIILAVVGAIFLLTSSLIPSSRTLAAMCLLPAVANNERIGNITENTLGILEAKTAEWLKEISKEEGGKND